MRVIGWNRGSATEAKRLCDSINRMCGSWNVTRCETLAKWHSTAKKRNALGSMEREKKRKSGNTLLTPGFEMNEEVLKQWKQPLWIAHTIKAVDSSWLGETEQTLVESPCLAFLLRVLVSVILVLRQLGSLIIFPLDLFSNRKQKKQEKKPYTRLSYFMDSLAVWFRGISTHDVGI